VSQRQMGLRRLGSESSPDSLLEGNGFETSSSAPDRQRFRGFVQDGVRAPVERGGIIEHLLVLGGEIDLPRGNSTSRRSPPNETAPHP
jgi:hypothetical protein